MPILALATAAWLFMAALLLFGMLVVVRSVFDVVKEAKSLARRMKESNERLGEAARDVRTAADEATGRLEAIRRRRSERRS